MQKYLLPLPSSKRPGASSGLANGPALLLVGLWALTMLSLPVVRWSLGAEFLEHGLAAGVAAQVLAVMLILGRAWGRRRALSSGAAVVALAWLAEFAGSRTGFPFGAYRYTGVLQPQLGGVPVLIPLAWLMMLPPAWAVAAHLGGRILPSHAPPWQRRLLFIALSALAFTAWDLYLDPQMVAWNFWAWLEPGAYFGIPLSNFLGWLLVSALITALVNPPAMPETPLLLDGITTSLLEFGGRLFFWGPPGSPVAGLEALLSRLLPGKKPPAS